MVVPIEQEETAPHFTTVRFDQTDESWFAIKDIINALNISEVHMDTSDGNAILGDRVGETDLIAYPSLKEAMQDPGTITELLYEGTRLIGYTMAIPQNKFNPENDNPTVAYIYNTIIHKDYQGKGLVSQIVDPLFRDMHEAGYTVAIRDTMVGNGYAAKVLRHFEGSILEQYERPDPYGLGPQHHIVIDIPAYVSTLVA